MVSDATKVEEVFPGATDSTDKKKAKRAKTRGRVSDETHDEQDTKMRGRVSDETYDEQDTNDIPHDTPWGRKQAASSVAPESKMNALRALARATEKAIVLRCAITEVTGASHPVEVHQV